MSVASEFMQTFDPSGSTMSSLSPHAVRYSKGCAALISAPAPASDATSGVRCQNHTAPNAAATTAAAAHIAQEPTPAPSGDLGDSEQDLVAGCETRPFPLRLGRRGQLPSGETLPEISPVFIRLLQPSRQHTGLLLI